MREGQPPAIVVPGHGRTGLDGVHRITERCMALVAEAGRLAVALSPDAVILSGRSEAEQMKDMWAGPGVDVVVETEARSTAENAALTLPLLVERGVTSAVVVCAPAHLRRAGVFFRRVYAERGVEATMHRAPVPFSLRAVVRELLLWPLVPFQLHAARRRVRGEHV